MISNWIDVLIPQVSHAIVEDASIFPFGYSEDMVLA
jgi:hypothetical protein